MRIIDYTPNSTVDGSGVRQVFWLAGCPHHCEGCHNPETWNPFIGKRYKVDEVIDMASKSPFNVTFSGGEPFLQFSELNVVTARLKKLGKNIWIYTGYKWEDLVKDVFHFEVLCNIDVLVDGKFVKELANPKLQFRGSSNQRIIDVQCSIKKGEVVLWKDGNYV